MKTASLCRTARHSFLATPATWSGRRLSPSAKPSVRHCTAASARSDVDALKSLKTQGARPSATDPAYTAASDYLKEIGINNLAEISRVLDIAMNPNSLFLAKTKNANARPLDVDKDMRPVVEFLVSKKVPVGEIVKIVTGHPPMLSYTTVQLEGFWQYLESIGITDVGAVVAGRPNLLGLDVDDNLRKIVEYLKYVETPAETIVKYLAKSI